MKQVRKLLLYELQKRREKAKERKKKLCKQNEKKEKKYFVDVSRIKRKKRNCRFFNIQVIMSVLSQRLRLRGWNIKF